MLVLIPELLVGKCTNYVAFRTDATLKSEIVRSAVERRSRLMSVGRESRGLYAVTVRCRFRINYPKIRKQYHVECFQQYFVVPDATNNRRIARARALAVPLKTTRWFHFNAPCFSSGFDVPTLILILFVRAEKKPYLVVVTYNRSALTPVSYIIHCA